MQLSGENLLLDGEHICGAVTTIVPQDMIGLVRWDLSASYQQVTSKLKCVGGVATLVTSL